MTRLRLCGWQTGSVMADPDANLAALTGAAERARQGGADILITPEMYVCGYDIEPAQLAALAGRDLHAEVAAVAAQAGIAIVTGLPEYLSAGIANTVLFVGADGEEVLRHRKCQLFGDLDRRLFVAGDHRATLGNYRGITFAAMICYDVEFPESVRAAASAGAQAVLVPTAQMSPFEIVTTHVIPVRAWENGVYVAYIDRIGAELSTTYIGASSICSPRGEVLARADAEAEALLFADVDTDVVTATQSEFTYLTDLRGDALPPRRPT